MYYSYNKKLMVLYNYNVKFKFKKNEFLFVKLILLSEMSSTYNKDEYPIYTGKLEKWLEENLEEIIKLRDELAERNSELADLKNQRNHQAVHIIQLAEKIGKQTEEISRLTYFLNQGSNTIANLKHRLSNLMTNQPPTYVCYPPPYNNML